MSCLLALQVTIHNTTHVLLSSTYGALILKAIHAKQYLVAAL